MHDQFTSTKKPYNKALFINEVKLILNILILGKYITNDGSGKNILELNVKIYQWKII